MFQVSLFLMGDLLPHSENLALLCRLYTKDLTLNIMTRDMIRVKWTGPISTIIVDF